MAFIAWRVAQDMLKRMRGAVSTSMPAPPYFAFMREVLVFLIAVSTAWPTRAWMPEARVDFTTALVRHVAETLQDNEYDLLGAPAAGQTSSRDRFIDLFNELVDHYADFGVDGARAGRSPIRLHALPRAPPRADCCRRRTALGARPGHGHRGARGRGA